ncbi:unnamed protein product, partial [Closterium sp. NIES-53]
MALRPSSVPQRVVLPEPPASSLPHVPDLESELARASSPTVTHLLATVVTDPDLESTAEFSLVTELVDFATRSRLHYVASLVTESESVCPTSVEGEPTLSSDVLEDRQFELECLAATLPRFASMLLCPEGDPDAIDIPTPRPYAEAIASEYSSKWQIAMDAEMASWKSTGTYVDEFPPPGANIVDGMWIFRGVDFFQTFSLTPKMTTLRVLLHVAAQSDYELHSLDFSTAFLQCSLHAEIWLRRPSSFTGSFPAGTQWSLRRPVYGLRQAPREWQETLRTTLAALGFAPSSANPLPFLRTETTLSPFYVLVYVDDLVFAIADTEALALVKAELQERHTCTDLVCAPNTRQALETPVVVDASASSAVKRTADLFTEADKEALQPVGSAHEVWEAACDLLNASNGGKLPTTDNGVKPVVPSRSTGTNLHAAKDAASNIPPQGVDDEEDDGYLSDDPEERYDAQAKSEVAQRVRFAIVLLIPIAFKPETTHVQATLRALFNLWKKDLNMEIQATTKFQELSVVFLNKKQYWRLQVTFDRARDANFVWKHGIVHTCVDGKRINLDWQHPADPAYVKARAADPLLVEVLFKGGDAVITPEMLCDMLVTVKLEKRGRSAFKERSCFHRVVNPVTRMDTDKVKGLVKQHAGDKYRWRHMIEDPISHDKQLLVHYPSQNCAYCSGYHMT